MKLVSWLSISAFLGGALLTGAVNERRLSHWAWQPLQEIEGSSTRSVDSFIEEKLKNNGLQLSPKAERHTLIRRLTHDLHGLPPTPEEVDAFIADKTRMLMRTGRPLA